MSIVIIQYVKSKLSSHRSVNSLFKTENFLWKFHDFSIAQILREINFGDSRSAKSALLTHFEALNIEFLHFLKAENG